ncbi:MAG TPA: hypothetical protein PL029_05855, partial [Bacteroidia bacterium]|nr:hypothetical protein [Bacteroidia bacterium]
VGRLKQKMIRPKMTAGLNCTIQYTTSNIFNKNKKGKARPKKAGIQNKSGEMYLAMMAMSKAIMSR